VLILIFYPPTFVCAFSFLLILHSLSVTFSSCQDPSPPRSHVFNLPCFPRPVHAPLPLHASTWLPALPFVPSITWGFPSPRLPFSEAPVYQLFLTNPSPFLFPRSLGTPQAFGMSTFFPGNRSGSLPLSPQRLTILASRRLSTNTSAFLLRITMQGVTLNDTHEGKSVCFLFPILIRITPEPFVIVIASFFPLLKGHGWALFPPLSYLDPRWQRKLSATSP